jgi:hypothetical protein
MTQSVDQIQRLNFPDNFLQFLGNDSYESLRINLYKAFDGDSFEQNNCNALDNFFYDINQDQQASTLISYSNSNNNDDQDIRNFFDIFINWGQEKIDQAFRWRFKVALATSIFLAVALTISLKVNLIAGIALAGATTITSAISEGVAKRNISTYGHLSQHLAKKVLGVSKKIINDYLLDSDLNDEAKNKLKTIKTLNYHKTSAVFRGLSYFSGFSVNATKNVTERLAPFLNLATSIIGFIIPILPILVTFFSKLSSSFRQKTIQNQAQSLKDLSEIICDSRSWHQGVDVNLKKDHFKENFKQYLEETDNHGKLPHEKGYHKFDSHRKDHLLNPTKAIVAPVWLSAKINRKVSKLFKINHNDIAKVNPNIINPNNRQTNLQNLPNQPAVPFNDFISITPIKNPNTRSDDHNRENEQKISQLNITRTDNDKREIETETSQVNIAIANDQTITRDDEPMALQISSQPHAQPQPHPEFKSSTKTKRKKVKSKRGD